MADWDHLHVLTSGLGHLSGLPLPFHGRLFLQIPVVSHIRDLLRVLLDTESLRIISHLRELALGLFKIRVILDI